MNSAAAAFANLGHLATAYVFFYPLFMSWLWMLGALIFRVRYEGSAAAPDMSKRDAVAPVSVLIPCYNEGENAEETLGAALKLNYPDFEVIAINDGSRDNTGEVLDRMAARHPALRVVHLAKNQGKAMALHAGAMLAKNEILLCIDGDALLDPDCAHWMARHFTHNPHIGAVTGNPRIRNRSTLLGRIQVGEFSSIVGMIKRAQTIFGALMTVSGVIVAFRRSAVESVGYWSADMLTEDIDITWKLQRAGWKVAFEPGALVWILMPETLQGLWKQRLRWAQGGAQVLFKNFGVLAHFSQRKMWPLLAEMCASALWVYLFLILAASWLLGALAPELGLPPAGSPFLPHGPGMWLVGTCILQFMLTMWMDNKYERGLWRYYYWIVWYPAFYWAINVAGAAIAFPTIAMRKAGKRARWVSPDRGIRPS